MFTCRVFMLHGGILGSACCKGCQPCMFKMSLSASARSAALAVCGWLCVLRLGSERRKWNLQTVKSNVENRRYLSRSWSPSSGITLDRCADCSRSGTSPPLGPTLPKCVVIWIRIGAQKLVVLLSSSSSSRRLGGRGVDEGKWCSQCTD